MSPARLRADDVVSSEAERSALAALREATASPDQNRDFFAAVMAWWRPHVRHRAVRDLPLDLVYALWLGPVQEYCRLWLAGRAGPAPRRAAPVLADGAWHALKGDTR